jgi:decaprenylphospho-beta-D-erythro-pentofuranosid-2-ulose 2-reductase
VIDALGSIGSLLLVGGTSDIAVATAHRYLRERPRASNFVYGSTKAGLDAFFSGLADSVVGTGVSVLVVRPGFVRSKMTEGLPDAPLATTPEAVADAIVEGVRRGRHTVWVPGAMRWVMSGLRHTPRAVFRRLPI